MSTATHKLASDGRNCPMPGYINLRIGGMVAVRTFHCHRRTISKGEDGLGIMKEDAISGEKNLHCRNFSVKYDLKFEMGFSFTSIARALKTVSTSL